MLIRLSIVCPPLLLPPPGPCAYLLLFTRSRREQGDASEEIRAREGGAEEEAALSPPRPPGRPAAKRRRRRTPMPWLSSWCRGASAAAGEEGREAGAEVGILRAGEGRLAVPGVVPGTMLKAAFEGGIEAVGQCDAKFIPVVCSSNDGRQVSHAETCFHPSTFLRCLVLMKEDDIGRGGGDSGDCGGGGDDEDDDDDNDDGDDDDDVMMVMIMRMRMMVSW